VVCGRAADCSSLVFCRCEAKTQVVLSATRPPGALAALHHKGVGFRSPEWLPLFGHSRVCQRSSISRCDALANGMKKMPLLLFAAWLRATVLSRPMRLHCSDEAAINCRRRTTCFGSLATCFDSLATCVAACIGLRSGDTWAAGGDMAATHSHLELEYNLQTFPIEKTYIRRLNPFNETSA